MLSGGFIWFNFFVDYIGWIILGGFFWVGYSVWIIVGWVILSLFLWAVVLWEVFCVVFVLCGRTQPSAVKFAGEVHKLT